MIVLKNCECLSNCFLSLCLYDYKRKKISIENDQGQSLMNWYERCGLLAYKPIVAVLG